MAISVNSQLRASTGILLLTTIWTLIYCSPPIFFSLFIAIILFIMMIELKNMISNNTQFFLLAPVYLIIPCLFLIYFNQKAIYKTLLFYLFIIVFNFDTASYIVGKISSKFWNTTKIAPTMSPGKSLEGFCGGYIATTIMLQKISSLEHWSIYFFSGIICIIAFAGDIFESYLKRCAKIKDSGHFLPGHGGLLDRFDSILFITYLFFIFKNYLIKII